jgi:hypothetical protein
MLSGIAFMMTAAAYTLRPAIKFESDFAALQANAEPVAKVAPVRQSGRRWLEDRLCCVFGLWPPYARLISISRPISPRWAILLDVSWIRDLVQDGRGVTSGLMVYELLHLVTANAKRFYLDPEGAMAQVDAEVGEIFFSRRQHKAFGLVFPSQTECIKEHRPSGFES